MAATDVVDALTAHGCQYVFGVPDSLLKVLIAEIERSWSSERHVVAANEGAAVGLAIGAYLGTGTVPVVYLQNSGLGNATNPLVSLAGTEVFGIPILLLVGWRGELDAAGHAVGDEPQHVPQGRITLDLLACMDIPYRVLEPTDDPGETVGSMLALARERSGPVALVFRRDVVTGTFAKPRENAAFPDRPAIVEALVSTLPDGVPVVATTGLIGRELLRARSAARQDTAQDFLVIGGMGHANSIAAGLASSRPETTVVCLDGDGAVAMHTGGLFTTATVPNLVHVVINNGVHESVGGQATAARGLSLIDVARACGYARAEHVDSLAGFAHALDQALTANHSCFIEVMASVTDQADPPRPASTPRQLKDDFMRALGR